MIYSAESLSPFLKQFDIALILSVEAMWNMSSTFTSTRCFICWADKKQCLSWLTHQSLFILSSTAAGERENVDGEGGQEGV